MKTKNQPETPVNPITHAVRVLFTEGRTAEFTYSDPIMAKEHFLQLDAQRVMMGQIIKNVTLDK